MTDKNIKNLISSQLPDFVEEYHPLFRDFMVAYYEWLSSDETQIIPKTSMNDYLERMVDVDRTLDLFIDDFRKKYLKDFPVNLAVNQRTGEKLNIRNIVKNIKDFYLARGTEKSYRFLFRVVYNSEVDFYYPKTDIMKLSHGKWQNNIIARLNPRPGINIFDYIGKEIYQRERNTDPRSQTYFKAKLVNVERYFEGKFSFFQLYLENVVGSIDQRNDNRIYSEGTLLGTFQKLLVGVDIITSGEDYSVGDKLIFLSPNNPTIGLSPSAFISRTINFGDKSGQVAQIQIENPGFNAEEFNFDGVDSSDSGATGFDCTLRKSFVFPQRGRYLNNDGKLSSNKFIQDNRYYQEFSYVLRTERTLENLRNLVKRVLHPSGYQFFAEILLRKCVKLNPTAFIQVLGKKDNRIGNFLPYTFQTFDDLSEWFGENCYYSEVHDPLIQQGTTGNPISSGVAFSLVTGASCSSEGLSGSNLFPSESLGYWVTFSHPNRYINTTTNNFGVARIHFNQLEDFYGASVAGSGSVVPPGWSEWIEGSTSAQVAFFEELSSLGTGSSRNVGLINNQSTEFRKIVIGSFLDFIEYDYDCRRPNIEDANVGDEGKVKVENPQTIVEIPSLSLLDSPIQTNIV